MTAIANSAGRGAIGLVEVAKTCVVSIFKLLIVLADIFSSWGEKNWRSADCCYDTFSIGNTATIISLDQNAVSDSKLLVAVTARTAGAISGIWHAGYFRIVGGADELTVTFRIAEQACTQRLLHG